MKKFISMAALLLIASGAQASTIYTISNITYLNTFGTNPVSCTGCSTGTDVDDGFGNITLTGVSWYFNGGGKEYSASFDGTTTLAPTVTPPDPINNPLPAGSQLNTTNVTCTTVSFGSTDPCSATENRSGYNQSVYYTGWASNAVRIGAGTYDVRRVEAGIPWQGAEITPEHFPQEAGLDDGWISYTKGCYLGQETVARLHNLGHVNWQLRGIVFAPGDRNACRSPPARDSSRPPRKSGR